MYHTLEVIIESLINGQRKQMANQIDESDYDLGTLFSGLKSHLNDMYSTKKAYELFSDIVISYHRIKNR